jgi:ATP-binding cassette subfamily F protein 3
VLALSIFSLSASAQLTPYSASPARPPARPPSLQALFIAPDILLLDEPTNHLDVTAIKWLTAYIIKHVPSCIVVSHEADFLQAICTCVIHIVDKRLKYYTGTYDKYMNGIEQAAIAQEVAIRNQAKHLAAATHRSHGAGIKVASNATFKKVAKLTDELNESKRSSKAHGGKDLVFHFPPGGAKTLKKGTPLVNLENYTFGYTAEKTVLSKLVLNVSAGRKIAVLGGNGAGKTTLIKLVIGELKNEGEHFGSGSCTRRNNVKVAYVGQHQVEHLSQHLEKTVMEYACVAVFKGRQVFAGGEHETMLRNFGLEDQKDLQIGTLSGGQKARLAFSVAVADNPHMIVLDEPTNHLDHDSIEALTVAINGFAGAVVMVSHNAQFMGQCCNEMWIVREGTVRVEHVDADGSYSTSFEEIYEKLKLKGEH